MCDSLFEKKLIVRIFTTTIIVFNFSQHTKTNKQADLLSQLACQLVVQATRACAQLAHTQSSLAWLLSVFPLRFDCHT